MKLRPGLGQGGYTVTYRVISADSHPVSGGFVFAVGDGAAPAATVDELLAGGDSGPVTSVAFAAARAVQYGAIALAIGALVFLLWAWLPALRDVAGGSAAWQAASNAFAARLRALLAVDGGGRRAERRRRRSSCRARPPAARAPGPRSDPTVVGDVLATRFGLVWGLGLLAWLWAGAAALALGARLPALRPASVGATGLALPSPGRPALVALALPVAALALLPGLGGHAAAQAPVALNLPANVLHVLAVGAWLGGIVVLVAVLRHATARLEAADRTRLLAAAVARFSTLAGVAVAVILASGVVQSLLAIDAVLPARRHAPIGRAVLIKLVLLAGIVALGWRNRSRHLPALRAAAAGDAAPGRAGVALRRTLRAELAIAVVVLGTTGALAGYPPAEAVSAGPFSTDAVLGPARLEVTVEPARVGPNEVHLYLFDRRDGRQYERTKELTVRAALPGRASRRSSSTHAGPARATTSSPAPPSASPATGASRSPHASASSTSTAPRSRSRSSEAFHEMDDPARRRRGAAGPRRRAAHVTVQPSTAPAGGFTRLDVRVPNERDDAGTIKVDLKLPPGFLYASYESVPGWTVKVTREKLAKPVKVEGFDVTEQVGRITWTGDGKQGVIAPGQFRDFGLSVAMPKGKPGSKLTFKALQTYEGGEVVRWIGPEDADEPAPTVTLTAAGAGGGHGAPREGASAPAPAPARGGRRRRVRRPRPRRARGRRAGPARRDCRPARRAPRPERDVTIHHRPEGAHAPTTPHRRRPGRGLSRARPPGEQLRPRRDQVVLAKRGQHGRARPLGRPDHLQGTHHRREPHRQDGVRHEGQPRHRPRRLQASRGPRPAQDRPERRPLHGDRQWLDTDGHVETKSWSFRLR